MTSVPLAGPVVVLVEPQDIVNIASVVRIAKNFAIEGIRLVNPLVYDPYRIEGIAHNTADVLERVTVHDSLEEAVGDCVHAVALTARERAAKRRTLDPRAAALELTERRDQGPVAIVAGREDKGLTNSELDHCSCLAVIPTDPSYRSLNLAQAIAIQSYEVWVCRIGGKPDRKPPRKAAEPATAGQMQHVFGDWERALMAIDFFKTRQPEAVMRSLRELLYRARLDGREASLIRAMGIEVRRYLDRLGIAHPPTPVEEDER